MRVAGTHGLDGWRRSELALLPRQWWDLMAQCFETVERTGGWPDGLTQAVVPLIPKEGGDATPQNQRPITVLPVLYRAWAGMRYDDLREWQASWAEECMFGGIAEVEAAMAALETALESEEAMLDLSPLIAAFLDYSKFCDQLPREILWPLARHWGAPPPQIMKAVEAFYFTLTSSRGSKLATASAPHGNAPTASRRAARSR